MTFSLPSYFTAVKLEQGGERSPGSFKVLKTTALLSEVFRRDRGPKLTRESTRLVARPRLQSGPCVSLTATDEARRCYSAEHCFCTSAVEEGGALLEEWSVRRSGLRAFKLCSCQSSISAHP